MIKKFDRPRLERLVLNLDERIRALSPQRDPFLLRLGAALLPVVFFATDALYGVPFFFWLGLPFYLLCLALYSHGLLKSLLVQRQVSAELLIVLVMAVTLIDGKPLSGALVAWFIGLGLYISFTIIRKNREKIEALVRHAKRTALVLTGAEIGEVPVEAVKAGDLLIVPRGTAVPVDGVIVEGKSSIDESLVTGEPFAVFKVAGDEVTSGTLNLSAPLRLRATKAGDASFLAVIAAEIQKSLLQKSRLQRQADVIVQFLLLGVTAYSFGLLFVTGSLDRMATALSVICPCAWALATPTVFASGIGRSARLHILARGGEPLAIMRAITTVVLDKTGTVTLGDPLVTQVVPLGIGEHELLELAASVETHFSHPLARAILRFARERGVTNLRPISKATDLPGRGIHAQVEGRNVLIGSPETLGAQGIAIPHIEYHGRALWVAVDHEIRGLIVVQDVVRSAMADLGSKLRAFGVSRVVLATGDHEESEAKRVAELIGADEYRYNCKPEDKAELVKRFQASGKVAMVGDGVNDAPALAAADVGIAIGGHRNVALAVSSSDLVILGDDAGDLLEILAISGKMAEISKQNYTWAISFNVLGLGLVTFGFLNPVLAAFLHHISSVFVVANATRLYAGVHNAADLLVQVRAKLRQWQTHLYEMLPLTSKQHS